MTPDKELLELAAKAAGLQEHGWMGDSYCHVVDNTWATFDPLTDDGDALRLAVKLGMHVMEGIAQTEDGNMTVDKDINDPYAATRRAIVRAAAEIGKGMP